MDRALMDYVLIYNGVVGSLVDVHVMRGECGRMSDNFLVRGELKVGSKWNDGLITERREFVKVSELDRIETGVCRETER